MRPPIWIGHVSLTTNDLPATAAFYEAMGLRPVFANDRLSIFELRGGTHMVIAADAEAGGRDAPFDLMVEDVDATHAEFRERGVNVTEITRGDIHDSFHVTDPGGNRVLVNSTHVEDHSLV